MLLLNTKLNVPPVRSNRVHRDSLIRRLDQIADHKLALIAAPAGYGKTALVSEWIAQCPFAACWFSLDASDNDPVRFWDYVIAALETRCPQVGEGTLPLLHEPQPLPIETILATLINDLSALQDTVVLVLDDYHTIDNPAIHEGLTFFIEHLPAQLRLILLTRSDPPLPLARMRVRGQLLEIRSADLRFTPDEMRAFFHDVMGLTLSPDLVEVLDTRVEGWVAGLQLAGLALRGNDNVAEFVQSFAGDHRLVLDYLGDEILDRQSNEIQRFLLATSILERFSAEFCDVVTNSSNSRRILDYLERHHFFVVPLDAKRQWYRYHHLFADFLRHRLQQQMPEVVGELHRRASVWYEAHGYPSDAIAHALWAGDASRAAQLVQDTAELLIWRRAELHTLMSWLHALPEPIMLSNPRLCLYQAWGFHLTNQMDAAEKRIGEAEAALQAAERDVLAQGMLATVRSTLTGMRQEFPAALDWSRQALRTLPDDALSWRCVAAINLGVSCAAIGDVDEAVGSLSYAMELSYEIGSAFAMLSAFWHLASLQATQLRLREAQATCDQLERLANQTGMQRFPTRGYTALLLGEIMLERNALEAAAPYLLESTEAINPEGFPMALLRAYVALARLKHAEGDEDGEAGYVEQAESVERVGRLKYRSSALPVLRARRWLAQGNLHAVARWVQDNHLDIDDDFSYHREAHYLMLARYLASKVDTMDAALHLLERMIKRAEATRRMGSLIRALVLLAVTLHTHGRSGEALQPLARALALAEPEQPVRVFADEGQTMALMLERLLAGQRQGTVPTPFSADYAVHLLAALGRHPPAPAPGRRAATTLVDALSERELEVLRLLAEGYESGEVAERLVIAVETARKHIKNIYSKLDVHSRWEAIKRAQELALL